MIHPVNDQESHEKALRRIGLLWDAAPGSPEADELDALATLVDVYERRTFPILPLDPVEAIEARREQLGWSRKELEPLLGSRARVSEVLTRRRALTLPMIRRVYSGMGIPADVLITDPRPIAKAPTRTKPRAARQTGANAATAKRPARRTRGAAQQGNAARGASRRG